MNFQFIAGFVDYPSARDFKNRAGYVYSSYDILSWGGIFILVRNLDKERDMFNG